jgi:hypothetical protein
MSDTVPFSHRMIPHMRWLIICVASLFLLPGSFYGKIDSGLDPSWQIALHLAWEQGRIFGRDFLFTYGPLGVLSTRLPFEGMRWLLCAFDLFVGVQIVFVLLTLYRRITRWYQLLFVMPLCLVASLGGGLYSHDLVVLLFWLFLFHLFSHVQTGSHSSIILASILSIVIFYVKLNLGLASVACMVAFFVFDAVRRRHAATAGYFAVYMALLCVTAIMLPIDLFPYVRGSLEIANGYNEAMMLTHEEKAHYLWYALGAIGVTLVALFVNVRMIVLTPLHLQVAAFTSGFVFLVYKQSFVRADEHVYTFFQFFPLLLALLWWFTESHARRLRMWYGGTFVLALVVSCVALRGHISRDILTARLSGFRSYVASATQGVAHATTSVTHRTQTLSPEVRHIIAHGSVDVIPWEIAQVWFNGLEYAPRPVMQSYSAYTHYLDLLNARFYEGGSAPKFILFAAHCADNRYCFWDEAATKRVMARHYEPTVVSGNQLVLARREEPIEQVLESRGVRTGEIGSWIRVKESEGVRFGTFRIRYSPVGKLMSLLHRTPLLEVELQAEGLGVVKHRAVVPILETGVLLDRYVGSLEHATRFFSGEVRSVPRVRRLRFVTDSPWAFEPSFQFEVTEGLYR